MDESKSMGGGLAQAMFTKVADKFYDLVVSSDVGIIDVSWGLKDQKTQAVTRLTNQKSLEMKALDEDFRKVHGGREVSPAGPRWSDSSRPGALALLARARGPSAPTPRHLPVPDPAPARRDGAGRPALLADGDGVPRHRARRS